MSNVERIDHGADLDSRASSPAEPVTRSEVDVPGLHAAVAWLCRSHDVTARRGCSKGYSLVRGWLPAYPETSGYIIGTLLAHADRTGNAALVERAVQIGRWEASLQLEDGGVMGGTVETRPRRP